MELNIGYNQESLVCVYRAEKIADSTFNVKKTGERYRGTVTAEMYGRPHPKNAKGTGKTDRWTSSTRRIVDAVMGIYDSKVDPDLLVRRINISACNLIPESDIPEEAPEQLSLFVDYEALEKKRAEEAAADDKERRIQEVTLKIQSKYGKNALLKGMNLQKGATTMTRNRQIGGHRSGEE